MKTRIVKTFIIVLITVCLLSGCGYSDMPFNGDITFHSITLTIDEQYIRDSTESSEDLWVFEKGFYKKYIILSRKNADEDIETALSEYVDYMTEQGVNSKLTTFNELGAVLSTYTKDGKYCQEMLFVYRDSFYAVALRGGDES